MPSQTRTPSTIYEEQQGDVWNNPYNVTAEDGANATCTYSVYGTSQRLRAANFGFSVGASAAITGIEVRVKKQAGAGDVIDAEIKLYDPTVGITGDNKADTLTNWGSSLADSTYGGSSDMWGLTLDGADVDDTDFGFLVTASLDTGDAVAEIDVMEMTVYYTAQANETGSGGAVVGGAEASDFTYNVTPSGGSLCDGVVALSGISNLDGNGGLVAAGQAGLVEDVSGSGGVVAGATTPQHAIYNPDASGGATLGGEGGSTAAANIESSGGVYASGAALFPVNEVGTGGVAVSGPHGIPDTLRLWIAITSEDDGATIADHSNYGNHSTTSNLDATNIVSDATRGDVLELFGTSGEKVNFPSLADIENNFTYAAWCYPHKTKNNKGESTTGTAGVSGGSYVWFPSWGGTTGKAGWGMTVGTNGVSVFEHADGHMPCLLNNTTSISGWAHIAIVCDAGTPRLYINGSHVDDGLTSTKVPYAPNSIGDVVSGYGPYDGLIDDARVFDFAMTAEEVEELYGNIGYSDPLEQVTISLDSTGGAVVAGDGAVGLATYTIGSGGVVCSNNYANGFFYRTPLIIDHTRVTADLKRFPIFVNQQLDPDHVFTGSDFEFQDTGGNLLPSEVIEWTGSKLLAYVQLDLDSSADQEFYVYHGRHS